MSGEGRAVPFYCPFCGEEDLRPHADESSASGHGGGWHCRSCARVFAVRLVGLVTGPAGVSR